MAKGSAKADPPSSSSLWRTFALKRTVNVWAVAEGSEGTEASPQVHAIQECQEGLRNRLQRVQHPVDVVLQNP